MKTVKLNDICLKITDGSHFSPKSDGNGSFPYVTVRDISNDVIDFENCKLISKESYQDLVNNGCKPDLGDLLFSKDGTVGKVSLVNFEKDFVVLSSLAIIRPDQSVILPEYLFHILKSPYFLNQAVGRKSGTAIRRIILRDLKNIEFVIEEDLEEQRKIVARLDAAFEKISAAEVLMRRNLDNVTALQKSILHKYLSASDSTRTHRLGDVITLQRGYDLPKRLRTHGEYPLASSSGIIDTHNEFKATGPGVFTGRSGSVGNVFFVEEDFWPLNTTLYVKDFHGNNPKYCYWLLKNTELKQFAGGTGVPTLNRNIVHEHMVIVAEKDDQSAIAQNIDVALGKTRKLEAQYQKKLAKLTDLRQSLLAEAFMTTSKV